jgi:PIN domain nuclease of toxin-antitoxin system
MILLDTNAVIWMHRLDRRARPLTRAGRLYVSPATMLELQFLVEVGRVRLRRGAIAADVLHDDRWLIDSPPSADWFELAATVGWTRDPFDRLIAAHARLRTWKVATGDRAMLEQPGPAGALAL